jgi:hypothetical protein
LLTNGFNISDIKTTDHQPMLTLNVESYCAIHRLADPALFRAMEVVKPQADYPQSAVVRGRDLLGQNVYC